MTWHKKRGQPVVYKKSLNMCQKDYTVNPHLGPRRPIWTRPSIFRKIFREKFVHVFRFFREKKGVRKMREMRKKYVIFSAISVRFSENSRNFQVALGSSLRS